MPDQHKLCFFELLVGPGRKSRHFSSDPPPMFQVDTDIPCCCVAGHPTSPDLKVLFRGSRSLNSGGLGRRGTSWCSGTTPSQSNPRIENELVPACGSSRSHKLGWHASSAAHSQWIAPFRGPHFVRNSSPNMPPRVLSSTHPHPTCTADSCDAVPPPATFFPLNQTDAVANSTSSCSFQPPASSTARLSFPARMGLLRLSTGCEKLSQRRRGPWGPSSPVRMLA